LTNSKDNVGTRDLRKMENKVSVNISGLRNIGRTVVSDKFPITTDSFWFALEPNVTVNPFDFVSVENVQDTKTVGIVKELQTITIDGYYYESILNGDDGDQNPLSVDTQEARQIQRIYEITAAKVDIMANTGVLIEETKDKISINMPLRSRRRVRFSTEEEIIFALGTPEMENPIPAGVIETTNGLHVPVTLDISYLAGPDTAHVNASGISGNQKTTYLLFLLQSVYQKLKDHNVAVIIFNTKQRELLQIDKRRKYVKERTEKLFKILDLDIEPFENVTYFLPRGRDGRPNSAYIPKNAKTYSYELKDVHDRLELLFPDAYDQQYNLASIIDYIYESWPLTDSSGKKIKTWTDLFGYKNYPKTIVSHKNSLLRFRSYLQRFRKSSLFIDRKITSTYLGKQIRQINSDDVFVIDVGMVPSIEEQSFIVGDVMKSIDEIYSSAGDYTNARKDNKNNSKNKGNGEKSKPDYILVFVDEINRFLPKLQSAGRMNAVAEQIIKTLIAGRSRGTILFSAQQFKSATDLRLHENTGLHIIAKQGLPELASGPYSTIDESTKNNIAKLNKGELVVIHTAFRHPIKIAFPKAAFKKQ
jgi:DNA helicase HerA-like ATPase